MVRGFADMDRHSRASREPSGIGARDLCDHLVRELIRKYADQPMDLADACLVAMSEHWWDCKVVTIDAADFRVYRRRGRHAIPLITPDQS
jgi:hypothetical protein